jgi:hypothetical protein
MAERIVRRRATTISHWFQIVGVLIRAAERPGGG